MTTSAPSPIPLPPVLSLVSISGTVITIRGSSLSTPMNVIVTSTGLTDSLSAGDPLPPATELVLIVT